MKKKELDLEYQAPSLEITQQRCRQVFAVSAAVLETNEPEEWEEGNTDWWDL